MVGFRAKAVATAIAFFFNEEGFVQEQTSYVYLLRFHSKVVLLRIKTLHFTEIPFDYINPK